MSHVLEPNASTCWTAIREAKNGDVEARDLFAQRYEPVIRSYLAARWRLNSHLGHVDDAVQEVFVELLKPSGALGRAEAGRGEFRAFLYGVCRNVARRFEAQSGPDHGKMDELPADDPTLSRAFDRAWATTIMKAAADRQATLAQGRGADAMRRVELLRLRFHSGIPIRDIARKWDASAEHLHREYAKARVEFREALAEIVAFHQPNEPATLERTVAELLTALS